MKFSDLLNEKPKDWNLKYSGYYVKINDKTSHDLISKFNEQTHEEMNSINQKVQKAIDECMKHFEFQKSKNFCTYCVNFLKSKFKIIIEINRNKKEINFVTILSQRMSYISDISKELYESSENIEILINF